MISNSIGWARPGIDAHQYTAHTTHTSKHIRPRTLHRVRFLSTLVAACFAAPNVFANPAGGTVASGSASFNSSGSTLTVTNSPGAIINWSSFSISAGETTRFQQQSAASSVLNRVTGADPSSILGTLSSNGRVFLINQSGILVGVGARIDTAGFVASTLNMLDADFAAGRLKFQGAPGVTGASVQNNGAITSATGGQVYLVGGNVENQGVITASNGDILLAAGSSVQIGDTATPGVTIQVSANESAQNLGTLMAQSGTIGLVGALVHDAGRINADQVVRGAGGRIYLQAQRDLTLDSTSQISANGDGTVGSGGSITLQAEGGNAGVAGTLDASGGSVSINANNNLTTNGVTSTGGDITLDAFTAYLGALSTTGNLKVSAHDILLPGGAVQATGDSSSVTLTAAGNIDVASISARNPATLSLTGANASLSINPNTANNGRAATGSGEFSIRFGGTVNLPNVSPTSTTALVIGGQSYRVLNTLGAPGSTTATDLQGIAGDLGGFYALGSDIDAGATSAWNGNTGFVPLGNAATPFQGAFQGLGHTIAHLSINRPSADDVGLFGVSAGAISNVTLDQAVIAGADRVGALAGSNNGQIVQGLTTASRVSGVNSTGGLVGTNGGGGSIDVALATFSDATVTGTGRYTGGLVGTNQGAISGASIDATVSGADYVGGMAGWNSGSIGIGSCDGGFCPGITGTVSGNNYVGGAVGYNDASGLVGGGIRATVNATGSYVGGGAGANLGTLSVRAGEAVTGGNYVGGVAGWNASSGHLVYSNGFAAVNGNNFVGGVVGLNDGAIDNSGLDAYPVYGGYTSPVAGSFSVGGIAGWNSASGSITNGKVTAAASVTSGGSSSGYNTGGLVGTNYGNVSASSSAATVSGYGDVGGGAGVNYGTLDGVTGAGSVTGTSGVGGVVGLNQGTLTHATGTAAVSGNDATGGLAGINYATIRYGSTSGTVTGHTNTGGLAGYNGATLDQSTSSATVTADSSGWWTGGLVGMNLGTLSASSASGNVSGLGSGGAVGFNGAMVSSVSAAGGAVTGDVVVAGLVGQNEGTITHSAATAKVTGGSYIGGLVGINNNGTVEGQSTATGTITGANLVGGLVGYNTASSTIDQSGSSAAVHGLSGGAWGWVGGLVGQNEGAIQASVASGAVSGDFGVGGLVGRNTGSIVHSRSTGSVTGNTYVAGLVAASSGTITQSFSTGRVSGGSNVGGLLAYNTGSVSADSFWDVQASGQSTSVGGTGLTTARAKSQSYLTGLGYDFTGPGHVWVITDGVTYPRLVWEP